MFWLAGEVYERGTGCRGYDWNWTRMGDLSQDMAIQTKIWRSLVLQLFSLPPIAESTVFI